MGEYGTYKGESIKIGTCENMYYLRPDQIGLVESETLAHLPEIRFRFPFPDEDQIEPGEFRSHDRSHAVHGVEVPEGVEHYGIQLTGDRGVMVYLPCPYSPEGKVLGEAGSPVKYQYNGYGGAVRVAQQRVWDGVWVTVLECGACSTRYRLPTLADAEPVIVALRAEGDRRRRDDRLYMNRHPETDLADSGAYAHAMADRIAAGYTTPAPVAEEAGR